jgi:ABC-type transport system involved in cytochrome bd biosynthesis fused ATPase/permease subunit
LFRCTDKIKKFFLLLVLPIVVVFVLVGGCFTGVFSLPCCLRCLGCITGIYLVIWIVRCVRKRQKKEEVQAEAMDKARAEVAQ